MLSLLSGRSRSNCQGFSRRSALRVGVLGLSGLSLADWFRVRAKAGASGSPGKSVILIWLDGGPSQLESYDPKPLAPLEYRGPFAPTQTATPGLFYSELMEKQSRYAEHIAVLRSVHHDTGDHFAGAHWMLTGKFGATSVSLAPRYPSFGAYIARLQGSRVKDLPAYVGLPSAESVYLFPGYHGAAYLGGSYNPFAVDDELRYLHHTNKVAAGVPKCLKTAAKPGEAARDGACEERGGLLTQLDRIRREADASGAMESMDRFQHKALSMIQSPAAARAFDLSLEDPRLVDRYGDNAWGRYTLMARRLVEAGVAFVTVDMPHWDHHSSLVEGHAPNMRAMDQAVGALLGDLLERGMLDDTLVVVMGEFGRTPKINNGQPGIPIPGRDHWGQVFSVMLAGGGVKGGRAVGESSARAEYPVDRPMKPHDVLATVYRVVGIDPATSFPDHAGRPIPILAEGTAVEELF